jgi:hypothetical protein
MSDKKNQAILSNVRRVIGLEPYEAILIGDGTADILGTPVHFGKLQSALPDGTVQMEMAHEKTDMAGNRVIFNVNLDALQEAADSGRRVRSGSSIAVDINRVNLYTFDYDRDEAVNDVTEATWNSDDSRGTVTVNGVTYDTEGVRYAEFYDDDTEHSDPDRTVYVCELPTEAEGTISVHRTGYTDLLRYIVNLDLLVG